MRGVGGGETEQNGTFVGSSTDQRFLTVESVTIRAILSVRRTSCLPFHISTKVSTPQIIWKNSINTVKHQDTNISVILLREWVIFLKPRLSCNLAVEKKSQVCCC